MHASLLCIRNKNQNRAWKCTASSLYFDSVCNTTNLSCSDLNNEKCKNKIWKINIQNFGALSNSKTVYSSVIGSTSVEKERALIWDLSKRLTWKKWKLLQRMQDSWGGIMQDPKLLYHQKVLQWLNNYSRFMRMYSRNDRHSLHAHFKTKKRKK